MLKSLDTEGMFDPETGLLTRDSFWQDLGKVAANLPIVASRCRLHDLHLTALPVRVAASMPRA